MWNKIDIPIDTPDCGFELFTVADMDFIHYLERGVNKRTKPIDFELHLAVHILQREKLPSELLNPLKQWARENKMVMLKP